MPDPKDLDWTREELVLALDLALRYGPLPAADSKVARLSQELRRLDVHPREAHLPNHRSPDAVAMMVQKFAALDPKWKTTTSRDRSPAVDAVWAEFGANISRVRTEAQQVREHYPPPPAEGP